MSGPQVVLLIGLKIGPVRQLDGPGDGKFEAMNSGVEAVPDGPRQSCYSFLVEMIDFNLMEPNYFISLFF